MPATFDALHVIELLVTALVTLYFFMMKKDEERRSKADSDYREQVANDLKDLRDQDKQCHVEIEALQDRLTAEEKATIRQDGAIKLVEAQGGNVLGDVEEIRSQMVTKSEFLAIKERLDHVVSILDRQFSPVQQRYPTREPPRSTTPWGGTPKPDPEKR